MDVGHSERMAGTGGCTKGSRGDLSMHGWELWGSKAQVGEQRVSTSTQQGMGVAEGPQRGPLRVHREECKGPQSHVGEQRAHRGERRVSECTQN